MYNQQRVPECLSFQKTEKALIVIKNRGLYVATEKKKEYFTRHYRQQGPHKHQASFRRTVSVTLYRRDNVLTVIKKTEGYVCGYKEKVSLDVAIKNRDVSLCV